MGRFFKSPFFILLFIINFFSPCIAYASSVVDGVGSGADLGGTAKPYRRDENYVDVKPEDIPVWDNGDHIYVFEKTRYTELPADKRYLIAVSKYLDMDGKYTVQVDAWVSDYINDERLSLECFFKNELDVFSDDDSSVRFGIFISGAPHYYCFRLRDGLYQGDDGTWYENPQNCASVGYGNNNTLRRCSGLYARPYYEGKYIIFCNSSINPTVLEKNPKLTAFDVNPLSGVYGGTGSGMPYETTFRMLTGDSLVYNTFYYTSSCLSGSDKVSASGNIRLISTRLSDGVKQVLSLTAPQLLCQKSTYGTAYDIAYTNDDNLLSLLGISKLTEKYWDVAAQEWKNVSTTPSVTPLPTTTPPAGSSWLDPAGSIWDNFPRWLTIKQQFTRLGDIIQLGKDYTWGVVTNGVAVAKDAWYELLDDYFKCFSYNETLQRFGTFAPNLPDGWEPVLESSVADALTEEFTSHFSYDTSSGQFVWSFAAAAAILPGVNLGLESVPGTGSTTTPAPGTTPGAGVTPGTGSGSGTGGGDTTVGGGVVDAVEGIASMVKEIIQAFKQLLANIGEMGSIVKILFGFLPPEMIGFIRITVYGCLFVAFYKALKG